jgi:hypothetical protein
MAATEILDNATTMAIRVNGAPILTFETTTTKLLEVLAWGAGKSTPAMTTEQIARWALLAGYEPAIDVLGEQGLAAAVTYLALTTPINGERLADQIGFVDQALVDFTTALTGDGKGMVAMSACARSDRPPLAN